MLINRNYPRKIIQTGIDKAKTLNRQDLRTIKDKKQTDNPVTLVTTFNPNNPSIKPPNETELTMYIYMRFLERGSPDLRF